jgi:hypothetical protein
MGSRALHLTQNRDFLSLLGHQELVAISHQNIVGGTGAPLADLVNIDDQSADRFAISKLGHQLFAASVASRDAASDGPQRQRRQFTLHPIGEQIDLVSLALLEPLADEYGALLERLIDGAPPAINNTKCGVSLR